MSFRFQLDTKRTSYELNSFVKPMVSIGRVRFHSTDKNWVQRLGAVSLLVTITSAGNLVYSSHIPLSGPSIAYMLVPDFSVNQLVKPKEGFFESNSAEQAYTIRIMVENLSFQEGEYLEVNGVDRQHIVNRVQNWKGRINGLYQQVSQWLENISQGHELRTGPPMIMYEPLMETFDLPQEEIDTTDIYKNKKLLLTFKPKGLWLIGINGMVEIISMKGIYVLGDRAEQFEQPDWHIFYRGKHDPGKAFTIDELRKLL